MRINISLPKELLEDVDKYCKDVHSTRSEYFRKLIRKDLKDYAYDSKGNAWKFEGPKV